MLSQREDGFSLAELIVAMIIIATILMFLIGAQIAVAITVTEARKRQQATAFANEAIEQMRSIPWNILNRGMYSGFISAAGGDPLVTGGYLVVDDINVRVIVADPSQNQDLTDPWFPLFNDEGSHTQVRQDDETFAGIPFTVRVYVTEGIDGDTESLGLATVVEWPGRNAETMRTIIQSTAYRGSGCGDLNTQPFLAACQAHFNVSSSSGNVVSTVRASTSTMDGTEETVVTSLLDPASNFEYALSMRSAGAAATLTSQQVTQVAGILQYGGTTVDDNDPETQPSAMGWNNGYEPYELRASDDVTGDGSAPPNPSPLVVTQSGAAEPTRTVAHSGSPIGFRARSDYGRTGTVTSSVTQSCHPGVPGTQPCAKSSIANSANDQTGSGYIVMDVGSGASATSFRMSRRLSESSQNVESAWAARYYSLPGTTATGCMVVTDAGCAAAGAHRTLANFSVGTVIPAPSNPVGWSSGHAPSGLIFTNGASQCSSGFTDSVLVQRGSDQKDTEPSIFRCGTIQYWNGSSYTAQVINENTNAVLTTAPVTWTDGTHTITAQGTILVSPGYIDAAGDDLNCREDACSVTASAGNVSMVVTYVISWGSNEYMVTSTTVINGAEASASFKDTPVA